ncbi:glycosyltransferase [Billgrantia desiderata]|uniref:glycosyltransferase n=1 Tax=Billgrantia desiderata TaxID=52021 RepID=UPI00089EDEC2|nr:glycosyltransferase [Halomonas desiderata]SEG45112.1 Putative rhamnosyl transferase [Halomonas desiderata]
MKKIAFIVVRYSVLLKSKAWNIAKDSDFEEYRRKLFSKDRLDQHFYFFNNVMLPSIAAQVSKQSDIDVRLMVITSSELPDDAKESLSEATEKFNWVDTLFLSPDGNMNKEINGYIKSAVEGRDTVYATVRLDDDDALHSDYLSSLNKYLSPVFSGHMVSYPKGHAVLFDQELGRVTSAIEVYYPKIALGLAFINFYDAKRNAFSHKTINIFQSGKHTTVQERYPLLLDESLNAYVRMCYKSSDTAESFFKKRSRKAERVPLDTAFHGFYVKMAMDEAEGAK